ncbi:MAG: GMC family oxidoreductase [Planctomycetes bacterium]|nr:GMC family oxidoreductase [Planctomycetota bacterium]
MNEIPEAWTRPETTPIDFIVVGAGAGGAPLAARLAERGFTVLVAEMGPKKPDPVEGTATFRVGDKDIKIENTEVPLLHGETTEDTRHSLRFFVQHFPEEQGPSQDPLRNELLQESRVPPISPDEHGIFYPRAQGVGGCTIHNAMITVAGPSEDWDQIAEATSDASWRGERMRAYFERLERCHYNRPSLFGRVRKFFGLQTGWENDRHGTRGWLGTSLADLGILLRDRELLRVVLGAAGGSLSSGVEQLGDLLHTAFTGRTFAHLDPNHWQTMRQGGEGLARIPCAITEKGERSDPRKRLLDVAADEKHGRRLLLLTGVFVTEIVFDGLGGTEPRAIGICCLDRENVYEADPNSTPANRTGLEAAERTVYCRREVILCGGSFNTPQLLMLSGIGPKEHLAKYDIPCRLELPGVGRNLQDRYEVPVVAKVRGAFHSLAGLATTSCSPAAQSDPHLQQWIQNAGKLAAKRGLYATNGGLVGIFKRSSQEDAIPDLFIFALAGNFRGYHVGYSKPAAFAGIATPKEVAAQLTPEQQAHQDRTAAEADKQTFTWIILKARTRHNGGFVELRSKSPFQRPKINFCSFPGGVDDPDLKALSDGVEFVESFLKRGEEKGVVASHALPGSEAFGGNRREWIRNVAWGHHASGTCRIGGDGDRDAVLDSRFRVRGVKGLRVVDASVFPRIPGFFIVTNVYMIAEKAADVLTEDHPRRLADIPEECRAALNLDPLYPSREEFEARRVYPAALESVEARLVEQRRITAGLVPPPTHTLPREQQ